MKKSLKKSWNVRMKRTIIVELILGDCTREQAEKDPWEQDVLEEIEIEGIDWAVISVKENE